MAPSSLHWTIHARVKRNEAGREEKGGEGGRKGEREREEKEGKGPGGKGTILGYAW